MRKIITISCLLLIIILFPDRMKAQVQILDEGQPRDSTYTTSLNQSVLQILPFRGEVQEYYGLLPGIVVQEYSGYYNLHIRGSRFDEIGYVFEGIDTRSAYTGLNLFQFIPEALASIRLDVAPMASTNNAAGLLQHSFRRGGPDYKFTIRAETDRFTSNHTKRFGSYSYGYSNLLVTAEGKAKWDNLRFFTALERLSFTDHYRKFWNGFRFGNPENPLPDPHSGNTLEEIIGEDEIVIRPGNIPNADASQYIANSIVTADLGNFNLSAIGLFNRLKRSQNETPIQHLFNPQRIPESKQTAGLLSLQMDFQPQDDFLAHLQIDLLRSQSKNYDPLFGDDFMLYRDSLAISEKGLPWVQNEYGFSDVYYFHFPFSPNGAAISNYAKMQENNRGISGYLKKQVGKHEITIGASQQRRTIRNFEIRDLRRFMQYLPSGEAENREREIYEQLRLRDSGIVWAYGYDLFGKEIENTDEVNDEPRHPKNHSFFIEDKIKTDNLELGLGLRYDSFSSDALVFKDPMYPETSGNNIIRSSMDIAPEYTYYSPRFHMRFHANNQLKLGFRFGKYVQPVQYQNVYVSRGMAFSGLYGHGYYEYRSAPRAFDAEPVLTTQTDFQVQYDFNPRLSVTVSVFHKFSEGHLQVDEISGGQNYLILNNAGESVADGLEFSLNYHNQKFSVRANYTYTDLQGFESYPLSNLVDYFDGYRYDEQQDTNPYTNLDYNQPHRGQVFLSYSFGESNSSLLKNLSMQTLLRFNSGHTYTLYDAGDSFG